MNKAVELKFGSRVVLTVAFCAVSLTAIAENSERQNASAPSTTLSAAAGAANAAVSAANAASAAASAAANAAAAAVDAINAILPASQRITPIANQAPTAVVAAPRDNKTVLPVTAKSEADAPDKSSDQVEVNVAHNGISKPQNSLLDGRFSVPTEHSLVGLIGTFEIPVSTDERQEFASGVAEINSEVSEAVEVVNAMDLAQAVKVSLGFSRDVQVATAKSDQAKAQTGQARAFLLPSILLNYKYGQERSAPGSKPNVGTSHHERDDTSVTLKQPLLDMSNYYDWRRREVIEEARGLGIKSSQGDAYLATVNSYLALVSSRVQANMAMDYESQMQELFQYVEKRAKAGAATNSDKERVRARSLNAKSSRIEQEAAQAAAGIEFVRLVNLAPTTLKLPDMEDVGISIVPATLQMAMPMAIEANPDIASLKSELLAANIDEKVARSHFLPKFDLEISDNKTSHAGGADGSQNDQRMMVVMNWALFSGGADVKLRDEKIARSLEINYKLDDQRRRVLQSLTAQYATLESTRERIKSGYRELESISTAAKAMSSRMISGNQSLLDMLDVYDRFYQARTRLVTLHVQEMSAVAQIARLVQGVPNTNLTDLTSENKFSKNLEPVVDIPPLENIDKPEPIAVVPEIKVTPKSIVVMTPEAGKSSKTETKVSAENPISTLKTEAAVVTPEVKVTPKPVLVTSPELDKVSKPEVKASTEKVNGTLKTNAVPEVNTPLKPVVTTTSEPNKVSKPEAKISSEKVTSTLKTEAAVVTSEVKVTPNPVLVTSPVLDKASKPEAKVSADKVNDPIKTNVSVVVPEVKSTVTPIVSPASEVKNLLKTEGKVSPVNVKDVPKPNASVSDLRVDKTLKSESATNLSYKVDNEPKSFMDNSTVLRLTKNVDVKDTFNLKDSTGISLMKSNNSLDDVVISPLTPSAFNSGDLTVTSHIFNTEIAF